MTPPVIQIKTLGHFSVVNSDGTEFMSVIRHRKCAALLAYLALAPRDGLLNREIVVGVFWPEHDACRARASLRQALHWLRRELGSGIIEKRGPALIGINRDHCSCDVAEFEAAVAAGDLHQAVAAYGGRFLEGLYLDGAVEFERWAHTEGDRLARAYAAALEALADRASDPTDAVSWWQRLSDHDPYCSRITRHLMEALEATQNRAAAIRVADRHARLLRTDLGAAPDDEVAVFAERMRRGTGQKIENQSV